MSIASVAAQQTGATQQSGVAQQSGATGGSSDQALSTLSSNFQNFLQMLMTQLKNQDPTSPLDANQFTTELVQFSSVEQQINTNANLTQLIQLTQGDTVIQSSGLLGKPIAVESSTLPLQNGSGRVQFDATAGQKIAIRVSNMSGMVVKNAQVTADSGSNAWRWDGTDDAGNGLPDGAYKVEMVSADGASAGTAVPFSVIGTATAVQLQNKAVQVQLGAVTVPFSSVKSVGASAAGG